MADKRKHRKEAVTDDFEKTISSIVAQFGDIQRRAKELGIFLNDRELLECPTCGLAEDIASDGRLTTIESVNGPFADTGLRFQESDPTHFRCPRCSSVVVAQDEEESGDAE